MPRHYFLYIDDIMVYLFSVSISYRDFLNYYQGYVDKVEVKETGGKILWIHARHFRPFLTPSGLSGHFRLELDGNGNFYSLTRTY